MGVERRGAWGGVRGGDDKMIMHACVHLGLGQGVGANGGSHVHTRRGRTWQRMQVTMQTKHRCHFAVWTEAAEVMAE